MKKSSTKKQPSHGIQNYTTKERNKTMTSAKYIRGTLSIANPEQMDGRTRDTILRGAVNNGVGLAIREIRKDGVIDIDSYSTAFGVRNAALDFIERFISFLNEAGVAELQMSGNLMVTVLSGEEPVSFRVTVTRGVVAVEEASLTWKQNNAEF